MYINQNEKHNYFPSFGKFIKIEGCSKKIDCFRKQLKASNKDILQLGISKGENKKVLYLFSNKHANKILDLFVKYQPFEVKYDVEKYMKKEPVIMNIEKAMRKLKKGYFSQNK